MHTIIKSTPKNTPLAAMLKTVLKCIDGEDCHRMDGEDCLQMDGEDCLQMDGEGILGMDGEGGQARALCHRDGTPVPRLSLHSPTILSQEILPEYCHS